LYSSPCAPGRMGMGETLSIRLLFPSPSLLQSKSDSSSGSNRSFATGRVGCGHAERCCREGILADDGGRGKAHALCVCTAVLVACRWGEGVPAFVYLFLLSPCLFFGWWSLAVGSHTLVASPFLERARFPEAGRCLPRQQEVCRQEERPALVQGSRPRLQDAQDGDRGPLRRQEVPLHGQRRDPRPYSQGRRALDQDEAHDRRAS
jgi:hypothetical protein